jgi:putative transposon-encoded protein
MKLIEVDIVESVDEFGRSARSEVPSRRLGASAFES